MIYDEIAMNNGVIFQHTYDILYDRMNQEVQNVLLGNGGKSKLDASLFVPVLVTAAFACELLMKSMLPKNTRGHELDNLFAKLDDDRELSEDAIGIDCLKNGFNQIRD